MALRRRIPRPDRRKTVPDTVFLSPRETDGLGRTRTGPRLLSALAASGEGEEGGAHRVHAEVADDSQRDAKTSDALARGGGPPCLNRKTVADTIFSPN